MSTPEPAHDTVDRDAIARRPSLILEVCSRAVFHPVIVFAIWLLAAGHNRPGGGFVGGLTIAAALILIYATSGSMGLERALPASPLTFIGIGMLAAQATALVPLLLGGGVLQSAAVEFTLPLFGAVKVTSPLFFDIGVMLIVVGLIAKTLAALGGADPSDVGDGPLQRTAVQHRIATSPAADPSTPAGHSGGRASKELS